MELRCITRTIDYRSRSDQFRIVPLGDIHLGNEACDEKLLRAKVKEIESDPLAYWVGMGDYCEWINRKDKRFDAESMPQWLWGVGDIAKAQRSRVVEILQPIGAKCLGLLQGNHEASIYHHQERDVYTTVAEAFQQKSELCLGPAGFVQLRFRRAGSTWTMLIFATHGWWGGRLMGAGALNLERVLGWTNADVVLGGHDHKCRAFPVIQVRVTTGGEVEKCKCWGVSTGSFLGGAKYAMEAGYRPLPVGVPEILVRPDKHKISVLEE